MRKRIGKFFDLNRIQIQHESGRSLVEMLGTLAIMGILSMAGIWAYNAAMDKLRANTLINEAQKRAVVIAGQIGLMGSTHPTLGEFKENTFGSGTFSTNVTTEGLYKQFGIQVSGVRKRICQNILNSIDDGTPIRKLTHAGDPKTAIATCEENNNLVLIYNNDMSSLGGDTAYAEDTCGCQTVCGVCVTEGGVSTCKGECPATGTCSATQSCSGECTGCVIPEGETTGTCQACQRVEYLESTGTQWIDTRTYINNTDVFKAEYTMTFTNPTRRQLQGYSVSTGGYWGVASSGYYENAGSISPQEKDVIVYDHVLEEGSIFARLFINGVRKRRTVVSTQGYFKLFALGESRTDKMEAKMYMMRLYKNDNLVHDFVPVYAPFQPTDKQNCMYDRVSKTLFCNSANTEDFKTNLTP